MSHILICIAWQLMKKTKLQESTLRLVSRLESLHSLVYYTHGGCMPMTLMPRCARCEPWSVLPCCMVTGTCQDLCFSRWTSRVLSVRNLWCILHFSIPFPNWQYLFDKDQQYTQSCTHRRPAKPWIQILGIVWNPLLPSRWMPVQDPTQRLDCGYGCCMGWLVPGWSLDYVSVLLLTQWQPWIHGGLWPQWCQKG